MKSARQALAEATNAKRATATRALGDMAFSFSDASDFTPPISSRKQISIFPSAFRIVYLGDQSFLLSRGGDFAMYRNGWTPWVAAWLLLAAGISLSAADDKLPEGFTPLFNGKDFTGWKVPPGDNGHWKVVNG